jgi:iron complex outermembrane receptor protein
MNNSTINYKVYFLFLSVLLATNTFSQVSGKVIDSDTKEGIYGVKISSVHGERSLTNAEGTFVINIKKFPAELYFSCGSYLNDTLIISDNTPFEMRLTKPIQEINTIVVTAGKRDQKIEEITMSMEILKPELINNKGYSNLEQAVDQSPGVYAMDGQVSIRGGGGYAYGAGSRVMLLWNGVPMLSPDVGDAKWNAVPMEQASQIEIIKGASSVLYGSGALNGIIALNEKEPTKTGEFKAKVQSGIYGDPHRSSLQYWQRNPTFHLADIYYGKAIKNMGFTIGTNAVIDEGFRQGETEKRFRLNGSFYVKPSKHDQMKFGLSYNLQHQDVGVFVLWKNDTNCYQAMDNTISRQKAIRFSFDPYIKFTDKHNNKHHFKSRYYIVTTGNDQKVYDASFAQMFYLDYQMQHKINAQNIITFGATNTNNVVKSWVFGDHLSESAATYAQLETKLKKWDFSGGLRFEYCQLDTLLPDSKMKINANHSIPIQPIFRYGMHYAATKSTHFRASFGQGIRFPSIAERFVSTSVGGVIIFKNPSLRPESGWAAEIGAKQIVKIGTWKGMIDVAGFVNQYSNMTEFVFGLYKPDTMGSLQTSNPDALNYFYNWVGFQAQNAEKARISGLEFSFNSSGKIKEVELTTLLGYTYMNPISLNLDPSYRQTFSDTTSNMLKYRFRHLAKADIQMTYKGISLGFSSRYNSYMSNIDRVFETGVLGQELLVGMKYYRSIFNKGVAVFDSRLSYNVKDGIKVNLIANNIFNKEYVTRPGDVQAPRNIVLQMQFAF